MYIWNKKRENEFHLRFYYNHRPGRAYYAPTPYIYTWLKNRWPMKSINHERYDPNVYWEIGKIIVVFDRINMISKTGCINHALETQRKKNILIINKRNITKINKAVYPEYHWVLSFMVYAFHRVNVSSIRHIWFKKRWPVKSSNHDKTECDYG